MVEKLSNEIMKETVKDFTLDTFLDRHPSTLKFPDDYAKMVDGLRKDRAMFIDAQEKKKAKKAGVEEVEDETV